MIDARRLTQSERRAAMPEITALVEELAEFSPTVLYAKEGEYEFKTRWVPADEVVVSVAEMVFGEPKKGKR